MLERGTWWGTFEGHRALPETIPQIMKALLSVSLSGFGRSARIPLSPSGLIEASLHQGTIVVNSSAVGGNSVVSGAYLQRPAPQFYGALPPEVTEAELVPHFERIERGLQVTLGPQDERKLGVFKSVCDKEGWSLGPTPQGIRWTSDDEKVRPPCTLCNRCMFSCNVGAKLGMDRTLIPAAMKVGAVVRDLCTVETIAPVPGGGYEVRFHDGRQRRTDTLRARRVVVAAGTLNTLKILLRSTAEGALAPIPRLGRRFSMAGDWVALYRVPNAVLPKPVSGHIMDMQIRVPRSGNEMDHQVLGATGPLIEGSWLLRTIQGRHLLPLFGFGPDDMDGQVSWKGRGVVVRHKPQAVVGRIQATLDRLAQGEGRTKPVRAPDSRRRRRPWISFHPLGGCCMASDAGSGVVDFRGEVFGHPGLYVADASVFPVMTIAGPQLTVSALASWIAERIVKDAA